MPGALDGLADVRPLVEGGVVHHDHAAGGQLGQQILGGPGVEHVRVDGAGEQGHGEQGPAQRGSDDIRPPPGVPVLPAAAALPDGGVAMAARHVVGEAALVQEDDRPARPAVGLNPGPEGAAGLFVGLRVRQRFFCG